MNSKLRHLLVVVLSLSNLLYPATTTNAAPNPIEIISITESSSTSVEILFNSNLSKKSLSYYVINGAIELPVAAPQSSKTQNVVAIAPKNIKKIIKTKAIGLVTAEIKNLNPKAAYNFSVLVKTNKGKMISSAPVEYSPLSNLMDLLSNLPADWGNPKPIQLPAPAPTTPPIAAPAFTLSSSSESKVVNTAISGYSISSSGGAIASYSISPPAPAGLTFNTTTGLLTGTPTVVAVETTYTITATNAAGSSAKTFTLTVAPTAPAFTLSSSTETRTVNTAATGFTINSTGGAIASFAINATPGGMSFNTTTGTLTGTPNTVAAATNYTITATNASGSATATFRLTVTAVVYAVGQAGPGGGIIFYVAPTPFACGPTRAQTCTYLEAAPSGWNTGVDPARTWAQATPDNYQLTDVPENGARATAIGWGYRNTRAIVAQGNTNTATSAAALADSHTVTVSGVVYDDWYLASKDELNQMCKWQRGINGDALTTLTTRCTGGVLNSGTGAAGFSAGEYWASSSEGADGAGYQIFDNGGQSTIGKNNTLRVRPIRAF